MEKRFKYEVFLKITELGSIYVGFTKENETKIERGNKNSWTTQSHFFVSSNNNVITNLYGGDWYNIDISNDDINEFCDYIREQIKMKTLYKSYICKVVNKSMKEKFFSVFHANSPRYKNKKQSLIMSLGLCTAKLTEVDETDKFFEQQENVKPKIADLRPEHLKRTEKPKENKVENEIKNKPTNKTEETTIKTNKILLLI